MLEVGAGEGFISGYLSERFPAVRFATVDLDGAQVERQRRLFPRLEAQVGSATELTALPGRYDLVICVEVLEHLDDPLRAIDQMSRLGPRRLLLSVPHEPFFRLSNLARGKNLRRLGDDPGHIQHWGRRSFQRLLESRLDLLRLTTSYPWILTLARPR